MSNSLEPEALETSQQGTRPQLRQSPPVVFVERSLELGEVTAETPTLFLVHLRRTQTAPKEGLVVVRLTVSGSIAPFVCFQRENANWNVPFSQQNALFHELNHIETIEVPAGADTVPVIVQIKPELVQRASLRVQRVQATLVASLLNGEAVATLPIHGRLVRSVLAFALDSRPETPTQIPLDAATNEFMSSTDVVPTNIDEDKNDKTDVKGSQGARTSNWPTSFDRASSAGAAALAEKNLTLEVPLLQATAAKDVLLWNRSELATQFSIQMQPNDSGLTCTDLDSGLMLGPGPYRIGGLQYRRLRFTFTATSLGRFHYTVSCINWRNYGNRPTLHIHCLSGIPRPSTLAVFRVGLKEASATADEIDFGDVYAGSTVWREVFVRNCLSNAPIMVTLDQGSSARWSVALLTASEIPPKEERALRLSFQPPLGTHTVVAAVDGRFMERRFPVIFQVAMRATDEQDDAHSVVAATATAESPPSASVTTTTVVDRALDASPGLTESKTQPAQETYSWNETLGSSGVSGTNTAAVVVSGMSGPVSSINPNDGTNAKSSYRSVAWPGATGTRPAAAAAAATDVPPAVTRGSFDRDDRPLAGSGETDGAASTRYETATVRSVSPTETTEQTSRIQRKVFYCRARVSESIVRVHPTEIHLGDCYIESVHTTYIQLVNLSDLPAFLSVRFSSTSISVASMEPIIGPGQTYDLRIDFTPHRVNPDYSKQITVLNLRNPRNEHVVVIRANCVDRFRVLYHALFYRLATDRSTHVNELDYGTMVAGHPYIRAFQVRNLTDKRLILGFESPKRPRVELLSDPMFCGKSPQIAVMDQELPVAALGTTTSRVSRAQRQGLHDNHDGVLPPKHPASMQATLCTTRDASQSALSPAVSSSRDNENEPSGSLVSESKQPASMEQSSKPLERCGTTTIITTTATSSSTMETTAMDGRSPRTTDTCEHQTSHAAASQQPIPQRASATDQAVDLSRLELTTTPQRHARARLAAVHHYHHRRRALSQASSDSEDMGSDGTETDDLWGNLSPVSARRADFSQQILRIPGAMPSFFSSSEAEANFIRESLYPARVLEHARAVGRLETIHQLVMEANAEATVYVVIQFHASDRRLRTKLRPFEDRLFVHLVDYDRTRLPTGQISIGSSLPPRELVLRGRVCISRMDVAQPHINFGPIIVGEQRAKTLLLQNASEMPAFYAIRKSGSVDSDYLHFGADRQGVLRPFSAREVPFVFRPSFHGLFEECIWIVNLLDPSDTHPVTMKAVVHRRTHFLVYPPDLDFGSLPIEHEDASCRRLCWVANHSERRRVFVIEEDADHQHTVATALLALDGIESTDGRLSERDQRTHHSTGTWPCGTDGVSTAEALEQTAPTARALATSPNRAVLADERARLGDGSRAEASNQQFAMAGDASTPRMMPNADAILDELEQKLRIAKRKGKTEKVERLSAEIAQRRAWGSATRTCVDSAPIGPDQSIDQLAGTRTAMNMALVGQDPMVAVHQEPTSAALASATSPMQRRYQAGRLSFSLAAGQVARVSILLRPQPGAQGRQQISFYVFEQKNRDEQQCVRCLVDIEPAVEHGTCADTSTRLRKTAAESLPPMQPNAASTSYSKTAGSSLSSSSSEEAGRLQVAHATNSTRNEPEPVITDSISRPLSGASDVFMTATATSASTHPLYRDAGISGGRSTTKRLVNVSPLVIDFGRVPVGLTATSRLTIQNTSDRRVSFSVLEETRVALPATLLWSPMRGTVDVHGVVQVRLTFRPDCMGPLARTLVVSAWVRSPNESSVSGTSVVRGGLGSQPSLHASSNAAAAAAAAGAVESVRLRVQGMALARRALYLPQLEPKPSTQVASSAIKGLESVEERREETRMLSWAFGDLYMDPELSGMNAVRRLDVVSLSDEPLMIRIRSNLTKQIVFFSDEEAQKPLPVAAQLAPGATLPVYVGIAPRMPLNELWTGAVRALVAGIRLIAWTRDRDEWNEQHNESVLQAVVDAVTVKLQARVGFTFPLRLRALEVTAAPVPERCPLPRELVQPTSLVPLWSTAVMNASMNESSTSSLLVPSWLQPSRERDRSPSWLLNTAWYCLGDHGRLVIRNPNAGLGLRLQLRYGPLERMSEATTGAADTQSVVCSTKDGVLDEPVLSLTHHQVEIEPLADLSMEYEWRSIESGLYHQWIYLENRAYSRRTFDLQLVFIHNIRSSRSSLPMLHMMHSEPCLISASTAMATRPGIWTLDASRSRQLASKQPLMSLSWRLYVDGFPVQWPCSIQEQNDGRNAERWVQRMLAEPQPEGLFWESGPNELSYRLIPSLLHEEEWNALVQGALIRRRALLVAQLGHQWLGSLPVSLRFGCARLALRTDTISVGTLGYSQGNATVTVTGVIRNVSAVATKWRVVPSSLPAGVDIFSSNQVDDERQTVGHSEVASGALVGPADHDLGSGQTSSQVVACRETLSTEVNRSEAVTFGAATEPDRPPLMLRTSKEMVEPPHDVGRGSETILASSESSTLSETPSALTDRHQDANVSEDVVDKDLVSLGSRTANMILGDGVHLDAGEEALLGLVLRPAAMDLAAGPFQLPVVIENVFQPENRLVLLIQGVYSIRLLNETNPIYLNEQGRGVLSIGIPEAAQGDVEVKWHVQLVPGGPYTDVTLQDRASGATLRSLTLASGEKFELQVSASTAVNDQAATAQCQALCGLCSSVDSSDDASCRQRPVAWIELYLQRKQDTEACCRPERIPVYGAEYSLNRACSNAAEHAVAGFSDPSIVDGARESAKRESVGPVSSSSRLGSNLDAGPLVGYPVAAEPTTLLPVPIKTDVQGLTPPNGAGIDEAMAQNKAERLAATQREETGQALSEPISVEAAAVSSSGWVDTLEEDVGPRSFRLHGCAHVGAHLYEMDAGMVPLRSQQIQRTLVIVQRVADGTLPLSGQTGVGSVAETRTDPVESALEYKLHRIPTHWRRHDTEQVEWLSLDRMGGIIEPSRASQTITLTMQPHRLGLFREYLLLTDRKAPANLALIRVGMEVVAERTDASTIFQTSPMAIDYGSVMLHHVYRNKSIRIRNVSDQPLEFLLRHDLPSQARSELHFSTSNLALRKVTSVWVEKGASRRIFLYFRPEPETEESEQTTSIISRAFHLYVSCRLVRDYEESVEIRCACHPPQLRISTNDISFAVPSLSWRPSPTANLTIETLAPAVPDLYEVRSSALFFTVTERERGVLCIQPRLDVIAELAPDEKYIEEHCSVYNRRRPREFFWIRLRIKVGGDSAPEFSAALPRKRVFVLEETVSRFLCLYAAFWAPYRRPRTPGAGTDSMQLAVAAGERGAEDLVDRLRARQRWQDHDEREPLHLWVERIRQATGVDTQPGAAEGNVPTAYAALVFEAHYCTDELVFYALRDQSDAVLQLALTCYSYVFKYDVFQVYMRGDEAIIRALAPVVKFWYGQVRHLLSFFPDSDRSDRPGLRTLGPLQALGQLAATEWSRESVERA